MFTLLSTAGSWHSALRGVMGGFALLMLAPIAAVPLGLLAFVMFPAAIVGLPFLVASFFGSANAEHRDAVRRASFAPRALHAHAHA